MLKVANVRSIAARLVANGLLQEIEELGRVRETLNQLMRKS